MAEPTDDEIATQQAAAGAPSTAGVPADPPAAPAPLSPPPAKRATPTYSADDIGLRLWFRANIEWVIKEMDLHGMGATAEQREASNPVDPNP